MATLTLNLPDDRIRQARARLGDVSTGELEQFLVDIVKNLSAVPLPADSKTDALIQEALSLPAKDVAEIDWAAKVQRLREKASG